MPDERSTLSVGIDVGGTFTDLVAIDERDGTVRADKVLSTPHDQGEGVATAIAPLARAAARVSRIVHGTTVVTNMLLERRGARVALCLTAGAIDLLELRRQERASLYDLTVHHPPPLVEPDFVVGVRERCAPEGVALGLSDEECERVATAVEGLRPEVVAISLLHAYAWPGHEQRLLAALVRRLPGVDVVCSSDVLPEIREYERTATTACEAYARPGVGRYLRGLEARLSAFGMPAPGVVSSNGGMRSAADAAGHAASLALSGPAGGVAGAAVVLRAAGFARALTIDIGGTSADVGLILDGEPLVEAGGLVAGIPIALPRVLVETVSAGGGSIGWVDDGGALRVGPRSAGAVPGPVAFGRGGTEPTVTDAHVTSGTIRAGRLGAGITIQRDAAVAAVGRLGARLGVGGRRCAEAMIAAADASMARALRRVSVERGVDPRDCVLVAFGGGGPLHACGLADTLGMRRVLVPPFAGVLSALGLAVAPERRSGMASALGVVSDASTEALAAAARKAEREAGPVGRTEWVVRSRYVGQGHELEVPYDPGMPPGPLVDRFVAVHRSRYGFSLDLPVETVSVRCTRSTAGPAATLVRGSQATWSAAEGRDDGGACDALVRGPAVVALPDATLHIAAGWQGRALPIGGWLLEHA